jgi:hypothetical protein
MIAKEPRVAEERLQAQRVHPVPDVDGDGHTVEAMEGGLSTSHEGAVLNVVVEQERVVVHLEHGSRGEDVLEAAARCPAHSDAQGRSKSLPEPKGVLEHWAIQDRPVPVPGDDLVQLLQDQLMALVQIPGKQVVRHPTEPPNSTRTHSPRSTMRSLEEGSPWRS